jgi:hypothetical protein
MNNSELKIIEFNLHYDLFESTIIPHKINTPQIIANQYGVVIVPKIGIIILTKLIYVNSKYSNVSTETCY